MVVETVELFFFLVCTEKDKELLDIQIETFPPKPGVVGRRGRGGAQVQENAKNVKRRKKKGTGINQLVATW